MTEEKPASTVAHTQQPTTLPLRAIWLTFLGGALGSALRFLISLELDSVSLLFVVNLLGAGFLGLINGWSGAEKPRFHTAGSKWFWGAGFSGGFTTMSGLALIFVLMSGNLSAIIALVFVLVQLAAGLAFYALGFRIGRKEWPSV